MQPYLSSTYFFDYEHASIQKLVAALQIPTLSPKEKAIRIYLKIRDGWWYNAYFISFKKESFRASIIAQKSDGHCIDKSILLVTCLRSLGIPARLHFAKVKNHIAVEKLVEKFGTNELTPHGMVNIFLNGKWLKVSPAFNAELCKRCRVQPLDFDGEQDSIFQEYNQEGREFMEYLEDYGHFEDLPLDFIFQNMKENYPMISEKFEGTQEIRIE